jgi:tetratricopeptide (TPR) repeat protein
MLEAAAQLRMGLDLLSGVPEGAARQELELNLQITTAQALLATKGYSAPEAGEALARARQLCQEMNSPPQFGSVLRGQFVYRLVREELERAEHHAKEICHLGETRNDIMWKCFGSMFSGNICCWLAKFIDGRTYYENALSLWDLEFAAFAGTLEHPYVAALGHLSRALVCLGYADQARARTDEALKRAKRLSAYNLVFAQVHAWAGIEWATVGERGAQTMLRSAEDVLVVSNEQGFSVWSGVGNIVRGWCLGALGQPAEGIPLILQGLKIARAAGTNLLFPFFLTLLADTHLRAAQPDKGLESVAEATRVLETTQERWSEAEVHRMRGILLVSMNEPTAADESFRQALAVARRQSAKLWELRAAMSLACFWRDQGKPTEARELLAPVYYWFTEGFDTPVLKETKALLEQLST